MCMRLHITERCIYESRSPGIGQPVALNPSFAQSPSPDSGRKVPVARIQRSCTGLLMLESTDGNTVTPREIPIHVARSL